ncbi:uncharacterized protein [Onthophagus taurus]|uniref:uncharacterized protein n=1 Tax=Onthophagus taurus TaxID=166361 RepID=UPI0039BE7953
MRFDDKRIHKEFVCKTNKYLNEDIESTINSTLLKNNDIGELFERNIDESRSIIPLRKSLSLDNWSRIKRVEGILENTDKTLNVLSKVVKNQLEVTATIETKETNNGSQSKLESPGEYLSEDITIISEEIDYKISDEKINLQETVQVIQEDILVDQKIESMETPKDNIKQAIDNSLDKLRYLINEKTVDEDKKQHFEVLANKAVSTLHGRLDDLMDTGDEKQMETYIQDIIVNSFEKKLNELINTSLKCDNIHLNTDDDVNNITSLEEDNTLELTLDIDSDALDISNKEFDEIFELNYKGGDIANVDLNNMNIVNSPNKNELSIGDSKDVVESVCKKSNPKEDEIGDFIKEAKRNHFNTVEREITLDDLENAILRSFKKDIRQTRFDWNERNDDCFPPKSSPVENDVKFRNMEELMKPLTGLKENEGKK